MASEAIALAARHPRKAIVGQAVPIVVGQLAVMANGLIDSIMAGQAGADILAAMAVGSSVYISLYVGLMGVIIGLTPICSAHHGAGMPQEVGKDAAQGIWIALMLSALGLAVLIHPDFLFSITGTPPEIADAARGYLHGVAFGLPAALVFRVFYAMNQSISRPSTVMALQVVMLIVKVPLNVWFMHGGWGMPALGAAGFGWATAVTMWCVLGISLLIWRFDSHYTPFRLHQYMGPQWDRIAKILKLGLPIGGAYLIEVTSFTFIALLVSRFGIFQVGAHQIVSNMAAVAYMLALGISNATTVMTAQQLGAQDFRAAAQMVKRGLELAVLVATLVCLLFYLFAPELIGFYTNDPNTIRVALQLMPWVIAYHFIDAIQTVCSFALRAHKVSARPLLIYFICLWGVGIGGGMWLGVWREPALQAEGFWIASAGGLLLAALGLSGLLIYTMRKFARQHPNVNL